MKRQVKEEEEEVVSKSRKSKRTQRQVRFSAVFGMAFWGLFPFFYVYFLLAVVKVVWLKKKLLREGMVFGKFSAAAFLCFLYIILSSFNSLGK